MIAVTAGAYATVTNAGDGTWRIAVNRGGSPKLAAEYQASPEPTSETQPKPPKAQLSETPALCGTDSMPLFTSFSSVDPDHILTIDMTRLPERTFLAETMRRH